MTGRPASAQALFAALNGRISAAARDAGRDPATLVRSACVHVVLDRAAAERPLEEPPLEGKPDAIAARLRELGEAGADEAILVLGPITEASIRAMGEVVAAV